MTQHEKEILKKALGATSPFAFRQDGKTMTLYNSVYDAYQAIIYMIWAEFPRGYIDIPYFMCKYQGVKLRDAERMCGKKQYALVELWRSDSPERKSKLRHVLEVLLRVTGVDFDENAYVNALQAFDILLENTKIAERTESGALVKFIKQ